MTISITELTRMASEVTRYSGKVWASCLTAKNYQRDVSALLDHILVLTQELGETTRSLNELRDQAHRDQASSSSGRRGEP